MTSARTKFSSLAATIALGVGSLTVAPHAALAISEDDIIAGLFAWELESLQTEGAEVFQIAHKYEGMPGETDDRRLLNETISVGENPLGRSGIRPYNYWLTSDFTSGDEPTTVRQGKARPGEPGGLWKRRGNLTGDLPARVRALADDVIVADLQANRRLARQARTISGMTPTERAIEVLGLATTYPVAPGTLEERADGADWRTGKYRNSEGETCNNTAVSLHGDRLDGDRFRIRRVLIDEATCTNSSGQRVSTSRDIWTHGLLEGSLDIPEPYFSLKGRGSLISGTSDQIEMREEFDPSVFFQSEVEALKSRSIGVFHSARRFDRSPSELSGNGSTFNEYVLLGEGTGVLGLARPFNYWRATFGEKSRITDEVKKGISEAAGRGGYWAQRGVLTGNLPARIATMDADTIVTDLQADVRLRDQVETIDGMSPTDKAIQLLELISTYPVDPASLPTGANYSGSTTWRTGPYVNYEGDRCDNSEVTVIGRHIRLNEAQCRDQNGQPVTTSRTIWTAPVFEGELDAPVPNVSFTG